MNQRNDRLLICFISCLLISMGICAGAQTTNAGYNKKLADSLGSDEYGMKRYVLVILKTGKASYNDKSITDSLFRGHMQNIDRLAQNGKLVVAGPLQKNEKNFRGIFILNVSSIEDAKLLLNTDPAIRGGLLDSELYGWYGSAALPLYLPSHKMIEKRTF